MAELLRRQRRGIVALLAIGVVLALLAALHPGVPARQLQLNDGGIWVTNQNLRLVGHLNYPSRTLDGGLRAASDNFDVSQAGDTVFVEDAVNARANTLDTAALTMDQGADHGKNITFSHAAETTAFVDSEAGRVWVMGAARAESFSATAEPTLDEVPGARAVVGTDGVTNVVLPGGQVKRIDRGVKDVGRIEGLKDLASADITVVGDTVVVLDRASSMLRTVKGATAVDAPEKVVLQQPGPAKDVVLAAGEDHYLTAPLGGGDAVVTPVAGKGKPARPVELDGCGYLAWGGSGNYVRTCTDPAGNRAEAVEALRGSVDLVFRTNRDLIVLNDIATGMLVLVNQNMQVVDNWEQINTQNEQTQDDTLSDTETTDQMSVDKDKSDNKPDAIDDEYGVRPGKTFTLPVLENDVDPDGDLLTASVKTQPQGATVARARGGEALGIDVPQDAPASMSFEYTADDGRGGSDDATVRVNVFGPEVNKEPFQRRNSEVRVGAQGEASYAILSDFRDPEGDSMYVQSVSAPPVLSVEYRPDGVLTVKDLGTAGPGAQKVQVTVSDGVTTGSGTLTVNVQEANQPPIANADHVTALKGQKVIVDPLANDADPNGRGLRLTAVDAAPAGMTVTPDYNNGTLQYSSETTGTFYLAYQVANDSPTVATGWIRVDVADPVQGRPVPSDDLAMLPAGGATMVDALANDTDPQGGVLVLKSVEVPAESGLAVEIIDHSQLRMSAPAGLERPIDVNYTVSNGTDQAVGRVTVVPLPPSATLLAPRANQDEAVVREGDIVSIPVLRNDLSPSGLALAIDREVTIEGDDTSFGDAFVSRDKVRFRAKKPGTPRLNYTVRDTAGNYDTGQVALTIVPLAGGETNTPPVPQPLEGRVLAGATVTIPVPTDAIDPEGDSVELVGLASGPQLGTAKVDGATIVYTASESSVGTDTFSYEVADRFGARSTASLRVGVASPNETNQAPFAVPDDVSMRPDRRLTVDTVSNDVDPDGDTLTLVADSVVPTDPTTKVPVEVVKGQVALRSPNDEATLRYYYDVGDGRGGTARGVLTVHVSPDAVTRPPVAEDDLVSADQINGKTSLEVDVLANDYDPDGSTQDLKVATSDPNASVTGGNKVTVQFTDQRQVLLYTITDLDGQVGRGAIVVPPVDSTPPHLDPTKIPLKVKAGELLTMNLRELVLVRAGHTPRLTFADRVKVGAGADTSEPVRDDVTLLYRSTPEFSGKTSVTFEVTDGANAEDPAGRTATLSVPIEVEAAAAEKHQPVFRPSEISAAAGESRTVDLKQMVTDPDEGDMGRLRFSLGAVPAGFTARLSGSSLTVEAAADVQPGTTAGLPVTVTDGSTEPVSGTVRLTATASTRPLMTIKPVTINDGKAGQPSTTDLSSVISNPFSDQGKPVTILGQPDANVPGTKVSVNGLQMSVTPPAGYHGQLIVTYTAQDATKAPSRMVKGTVTVTVRDKPDAPTAVTAETHLSRTATVSWTAGANNGAPITNFKVSWTSSDGGASGSKDCGAVTTCLISTLSNNHSYSFTVTAVNEVGESAASAGSAAVRPDVKPNPPGVPSAQYGDKQITLSWAAAQVPDGGSPVKSYTVQMSPGGATKEVTGTEMTWSGLTNGTAYTFRVQAHNSDPNPSGWSGTSPATVPAGPPLRPAAAQAVKDPVSALAPSATVRWAAPNGNGDNAMSYEMRRTGGAVLYSGTATSAKVTLDVSTSNQSFEVRAKNKAGWGQWSPASNGVRGWQTPSAVKNLAVAATGANNQVTITFAAADGNGATAGEMKYYWRANGVTGSVSPGNNTVTNAAFRNGENVGVAVYAVSTVNGESVQGTSTSATVKPYGPPTSPTMKCTNNGTGISCSWSGGNANGRATKFPISGDWSTGDGGASGSHGFGDVGYSATRRLCVQAVQDGGATGAQNCDNATTPDKPAPQPSVTVFKYGDARGEANCSDSSCAYIGFRTANFSGTVSCVILWTNRAGNMEQASGPYSVGPNASYSSQTYFGYPGKTVAATCNGVTGRITW